MAARSVSVANRWLSVVMLKRPCRNSAHQGFPVAPGTVGAAEDAARVLAGEDPVDPSHPVTVPTEAAYLRQKVRPLSDFGRSGVCSLGPRPDIPRYAFSLPAAGGVVTRR